MNSLFLVQLTKIKLLVSYERMYKRYGSLTNVIDNKSVHVFIGGRFTIENSKTGVREKVEINIENREDYFRCYPLNNKLIWIKTIWDNNYHNVLDTQRHFVHFSRETLYFLAVDHGYNKGITNG